MVLEEKERGREDLMASTREGIVDSMMVEPNAIQPTLIPSQADLAI